MTDLPATLTKSEAEALVLARLQSRCANADLSVFANGITERAFGWMFEISVRGDRAAVSIPRRVIVNKHSGQVIASSVEDDIDQFVGLYEKLLAANQARSQQWCGTIPAPWPWKLWRNKSVAERAMDGGFYEIGAKEGEP